MVEQVAQSKATVTTKAETAATLSIDQFKPILPMRVVQQYYTKLGYEKQEVITRIRNEVRELK